MSWHARVQLRLGEMDLDVDLSGDARPTALIGPNGSGKTTLLRTIAGAHRPAAGQIRLGDRLVFDGESGLDLPPEERGVGYVPQGYGLFPHLSVLDNVAFGWRSASRREPPLRRRQAAAEILDRLGGAHLSARSPSKLSGGEQQRVALARALMIDPHILLLDEPLAALDAPARRRLRGFLSGHLNARKRPAVVVTHDVRDVLALDALVVAVEDGRVVQQGSADALAAEPATDFVAEFFALGPRAPRER